MSGEAPVKMTVNQWAAFAVTCAASMHVLAQEIYVQGGTQGVGIGAAVSFNSMLGAHADFNAIDKGAQKLNKVLDKEIEYENQNY